MRPVPAVYDAWAGLLEYPGGADAQLIARDADVVLSDFPEAWESLRPLLEALRGGDLGELEELFTRTFDNSPERALELGWHIYGETYARGAFLVRMRQGMRSCGRAETVDLPDHVANVLRVLARVAPATANALVQGVALPALAKIEQGFAAEPNLYLGVIQSLARFLKQHHVAPQEASSHA
jgi:nitrate reductase delta subunit